MKTIANVTDHELVNSLKNAADGTCFGPFCSANNAPFYVLKEEGYYEDGYYRFAANFNDAPIMRVESAEQAVLALRFLGSIMH